MCVNYCDFTRSKIDCPLKIANFGCTDNTIFLCPPTTGYFAELKIHKIGYPPKVKDLRTAFLIAVHAISIENADSLRNRCVVTDFLA